LALMSAKTSSALPATTIVVICDAAELEEMIAARQEALDAIEPRNLASNEARLISGNSPGSRNGVKWSRRNSSTIKVLQMKQPRDSGKSPELTFCRLIRWITVEIVGIFTC
jgi:hypothetical protein